MIRREGGRADAPLRALWNAALAVFSCVVLGSVLVLQAAHIDDKYQVNFSSGVFMGLARSASSGVLYPPLFDGHFYAGTRYMPIPILLPAAVYKVLGHLLLSEKLVAYLFAFLLAGLVFTVLRRQGCPRLASLALIGGVLVTTTGIEAATSLHWDTPALFLELAALATVDRSRSTRSLGLAAVLCALAFAAKLSAIWAPAAIVLWLLIVARRRVWVFVSALAVAFAAVIGAFELASHGRLAKNIVTLSFSAYQNKRGIDEGPSGLSPGFSRLLFDFPNAAKVTVFLLPFALVALVYGLLRRRVTLYQLGLLGAALVLVAVYVDAGTGSNHLIDVAVLSAVVVGGLWGELRGSGRITWLVPAVVAVVVAVVLVPNLYVRRELLIAVLALAAVTGGALWWSLRRSAREFAWFGAAVSAVLFVAGSSYYRHDLLPETKVALKTLVGRGDNRYTTHPLAGYVSARDTMLSEDPYIPVSLGQRPVILDEFSFNRLVRLHPSWGARLARRIAAKEFDKIILQDPIERGFTDGHFGPLINSQIARSYKLAEGVSTASSGHFWIYVPRQPAG